MNTEITDTMEFEGWVLYDADCRYCAALAGRFRRLLAARQLQLLPLQTPWIRERLESSGQDLLAEMRLLKPDGTVFGGADALLEISRLYPWTWPIRQLARFPMVRNKLRRIYRWVASHRRCSRGACAATGKPKDERRKTGKRIVFFEMP